VDDQITEYAPSELPATCRDDATIAIINPGSTDLVIAFTGMNAKFGVELPAIYEALPNPKPNCLFLADPNSMVFLTGHPAFGTDVESTLEGLKAKIAEMGIERVYTIGNSGGSFAATYYGVRLGAVRTLAFAPFMCFVPSFEPKANVFLSKRNRDKDAINKADATLLDLKRAVPKHNQGTEIRIYYAIDYPNDRKHAEYMKGVENVSIFPISYSSRHGVVRDMRREGDLGKVLGGLVSGVFPPLRSRGRVAAM